METQHPRLNKLRRAVLTNVDYEQNLCDIQYLDSFNAKRTKIPLTQPYSGRGWGVLVGVEEGSQVLIGEEHDGYPRIIAYLDHPLFHRSDLGLIDEVDITERPYRRLVSGEVALQGKSDSAVIINKLGDIVLETPEGNVIEIDRENDLIFQRSAQRKIECESNRSISGSIKRDIRSEEEKQNDLFFGGLAGSGLDFDLYSQFIGVDPQYRTQLTTDKGERVQDLIDEGVDEQGRTQLRQTTDRNDKAIPGLIDLRAGETGSFNNISDSANPSLAEINCEFKEYADSNVGLDDVELSNNKRKIGKLSGNTLGNFVVGTKVNEIGKLIRFDYGFDKGQVGHGSIWNTEGKSIHNDGKTTDGFFDKENTLKDPKPQLSDKYEWTISELNKVDTAVMFGLTLHTRGGNSEGKQESDQYRGSLWQIQVDKEGFTKLNIPAAKDTDGNEYWREGRSLLFNADGSVEASIGRQLCTSKKGLDRITGINGNASNFVNLNNYPNYGRKDRSLTLDLQGNAEVLIGRDENKHQSLMLECDGSGSFFFGKEREGFAHNSLVEDSRIGTAPLATDRTDRSLTMRTAGNVELHLNKDEAFEQSLMLTTEGGNRLMMGKDNRDRSLDMHSTGGVRLEIQEPMLEGNGAGSKKGIAFKVDGNGDLHIYMTGDVHVHSEGNMRWSADKNIWIEAGESIAVKAGSKYSVTSGSDYAIKSSGNIGMTAAGQHNVKGSRVDHNGAAPVLPESPKNIHTRRRETPEINTPFDTTPPTRTFRESGIKGKLPQSKLITSKKQDELSAYRS